MKCFESVASSRGCHLSVSDSLKLILIIYWRLRDAHTTIGYCRTSPVTDHMMLLNCWVLGEDVENVFQVEMQDNATTFTLRDAIKKNGGRAVRDVGAGDLRILQVSKVRHIIRLY